MARILSILVATFLLLELVQFVHSQVCGKPKSFDIIALQQQFVSSGSGRRKRAMPGHSPDRSASVHRRHQEIVHPWAVDATKAQNKIVGGFDVHDNTGGTICWQVGIIIGTAEGYFNCGGSILGSRTIVTAGHCVFNGRGQVRKPSEFTVVVGALDGGFDGSNSGEGATNCGKSFQVSKVTPNPQYNQNVGNNDLAMFTLSSDIDLSGTCACTICLDNKSPAVGEWTAVSGYGDVSEGGLDDPDPIPLRWVYLQVLNNVSPQCSFNLGTNASDFICAGDQVGKDSCQGDSGGPLVAWNNNLQSYYLAGIVSFGEGCARGIGGQYTKVQMYLNWIQQTADQNLGINFNP